MIAAMSIFFYYKLLQVLLASAAWQTCTQTKVAQCVLVLRSTCCRAN